MVADADSHDIWRNGYLLLNYASGITKYLIDKDVYLAPLIPCAVTDRGPAAGRAGRGAVLRCQPETTGLYARPAGSLPAAMERRRPSDVLFHAPGHPGQGLALHLVQRP
ncbi:hypothetical protein D3C78_876850 [compost metagenome]